MKKIEQVAIYSKNPGKLIKALEIIGCDEWHHDHVVAEGEVNGKQSTNEADLAFNYQLGDFEFEILNYTSGDNWHRSRMREDDAPFLSHLGVHVDDVDSIKLELMRADIKVIQEVKTKSHTNKVIKDKRTYHYVIFDTRDLFGFDLKLIQRIKGEAK